MIRLLLLIITFCVAITAKPQHDIGASISSDSSRIDVFLNVGSDVSGIFSAVSLTLKWDDVGIRLGSPISQTDIIGVRTSGDVRSHDRSFYQSYAGFSSNTFEMKSGESMLLMSIPITGSGCIEISNDDFAGSVRVNGLYYVSVNGEDRTGPLLNHKAKHDTGEIMEYDHTDEYLTNPSFNYNVIGQKIR